MRKCCNQLRKCCHLLMGQLWGSIPCTYETAGRKCYEVLEKNGMNVLSHIDRTAGRKWCHLLIEQLWIRVIANRLNSCKKMMLVIDMTSLTKYCHLLMEQLWRSIVLYWWNMPAFSIDVSNKRYSNVAKRYDIQLAIYVYMTTLWWIQVSLYSNDSADSISSSSSFR